MATVPAPDIPAVCPHASVCGGCDMLDVAYDRQTAYKAAMIREAFAPFLGSADLKPFLATERHLPLQYRNKIRYGFVRHDGAVWPSRHAKGEGKADIPMSTCLLQSDRSVHLAQTIARLATELGWEPYDPITGRGTLKHILVREGKRTGECLASLVTTQDEPSDLVRWTAAMSGAGVTSVWHTVTWGRNNENSRDKHLAGEKHIHERVGDKTFRISPHAFFQTNSEMVSRLYDEVAEAAALRADDTLWDLYAGSATIGIYLADRCRSVVSIESNPQNIEDATANLSLNETANLCILEGTVEQRVTSALVNELPPSVVVVDPPRAGLSPQLRRLLPNLPIPRLVYVSCNPATAARDCTELTAKGFRLESVRGVDMFPHTLHCEAVLAFVR